MDDISTIIYAFERVVSICDDQKMFGTPDHVDRLAVVSCTQEKRRIAATMRRPMKAICLLREVSDDDHDDYVCAMVESVFDRMIRFLGMEPPQPPPFEADNVRPLIDVNERKPRRLRHVLAHDLHQIRKSLMGMRVFKEMQVDFKADDEKEAMAFWGRY